MDFKDTLKTFINRLEMLKDTVQTEEATKMSLIVPFFQLLGYDVFNPMEFCPEYTADVGIKKGERWIMPFLLKMSRSFSSKQNLPTGSWTSTVLSSFGIL